jgi:hypothetical protein
MASKCQTLLVTTQHMSLLPPEVYYWCMLEVCNVTSRPWAFQDMKSAWYAKEFSLKFFTNQPIHSIQRENDLAHKSLMMQPFIRGGSCRSGFSWGIPKRPFVVHIPCRRKDFTTVGKMPFLMCRPWLITGWSMESDGECRVSDPYILSTRLMSVSSKHPCTIWLHTYNF